MEWFYNRILFLKLRCQKVNGQWGNTPETHYYPWEAPHALTDPAVGLLSPYAKLVPTSSNGPCTNFQSNWSLGRGLDMSEEGVHIPWNIFLTVICSRLPRKWFYAKCNYIIVKLLIIRIFRAIVHDVPTSPQKSALWSNWNHLYFHQLPGASSSCESKCTKNSP